MTLRVFLAAAACSVASLIWADAPAGYYNKCVGQGGAQLLETLETVIGPHTNVGYKGLWSLYKTSDVYPDGKIWDMYSTKHWTYEKEQCGSYSSVGDCYNREHSIPQSWFNEQEPMKSDAFHIYPTDGKVNNQRGNHPFGECANGSSLSAPSGIKALGKLGNCTFPGYSGTVFEPDDEYKGDFARSYFYMAACYNSLIDDWNSPMLAGNSYPAFTSWAVNLLLKWHRQDPVSEKERKRNEAVYAEQHNRNPFIDNPEMAEYIWGTHKNEKWTLESGADPKILEPATDSQLSFGYVNVGEEGMLQIPVKGANLTTDLTLTLSTPNDALSLSTNGLTASAVNSGSNVLLLWRPAAEGSLSATLTLASGAAKSTVTISGTAFTGLAAKPATGITDGGFTASWTYVGDAEADGTYSILVYEQGADPASATVTKAAASAQSAAITGLQPACAYSYMVKSKTLTSNVVNFSTTAPLPEIIVLHTNDGTLALSGTPGTPSDPIEVDFECENISTNITASVKAPFQLSTDKGNWTSEITLSPNDSHFYARVSSEYAGQFSSTLTLSAGDYVYDDCTLAASVVSLNAPILEDFEAEAGKAQETYKGCDYSGTIATWHLADAGIFAADANFAHSGKQAVRMGKSSDSYVEATSPFTSGIETVTAYAAQWSDSEGDCSFVIEYSADGKNWQRTTAANVASTAYAKFTFAVNSPEAKYLRVQQTAGKRFMLDDVEVTPSAAGSALPVVGRAWTAFARAGRLVIECAESANVCVYGMDGIVRYDAPVAAGATELNLTPGVYVVALGGETLSVALN